MEEGMLDNHFATMFVKYDQDIALKNLDQRVVELFNDDILEKTGPFEGDNGKQIVAKLLTLQILGEGGNTDYEFTKENGYLPESHLTSMLYELGESIEIDLGLKDAQTSVKIGYLSKNDKGEYNILPQESEKTKGLGFYLGILNNNPTNIKEKDCIDMEYSIIKLMREKYFDSVSILSRASR